MAGSVFDALTAEQKLRVTIQRDVTRICQETGHHVGLEVDARAAELVGELVWKKIQVFTSDLEAFAKHGKRNTINSDDIKLLVRRNPSLLAHITKLAEENSSASTKRTKDGKRKRSAANIAPTTSSSNTTNTTSNPVASTSALQNPEPSTSNVGTLSKKNSTDDFNSDSEFSPFMKILQRKISDRQLNVNNNKDEEMIDLSD